jgi:transketolase
MENHTSIGGLGSCVAEMIAKFGIATKLIKVAINDTYLQGASRAFLMERYGIDVKSLLCAVESLVGEKIDISDADLSTSRLDSFFNENQQEAL